MRTKNTRKQAWERERYGRYAGYALAEQKRRWMRRKNTPQIVNKRKQLNRTASKAYLKWFIIWYNFNILRSYTSFRRVKFWKIIMLARWLTTRHYWLKLNVCSHYSTSRDMWCTSSSICQNNWCANWLPPCFGIFNILCVAWSGETWIEKQVG